MKPCRITALRQTVYSDLVEQLENALDCPCPLRVGQTFVSVGGQCPAGFCAEAWSTLRPFVEELACGGGDFYDGWMKNPHSALLSCNDGFRPMSFLVEVIEEEI